MTPFTVMAGRAAVFTEDNVDTDVIFPARFLLLMEKRSLGRYLFHDRRQSAAQRGETFALDRPECANAAILIAGANFGCGSSREQAVWALAGAGFRCIIAPGFGDIFSANCFKNGLLPLTFPASVVADMAAAATAGRRFTVDLTASLVRVEGLTDLPIAIPADRREALLAGRDDIDAILLHQPSIAAYERSASTVQPWLFNDLESCINGARNP